MVIVKECFYSPSPKGWPPTLSGDGVVVGKAGEVAKWNELPFNPKLKKKAKELRKAGNLSEVLFWNRVKNKQFFGLDFDRQKIIGDYIVDFYCKNWGLVIEIDGKSHGEKICYDKDRDGYLESLGLKIFHIREADIKKNLEGVMKFLETKIKNTPSRLAFGGRATPLKEGNF